MALAATSLLAACQPRSAALPDEVFGHWTTNASRYQDRFFDLDEDHLTFGTGGESSYSNPILQIQIADDDGLLLYQVEHQGSEGQSYTFSFYYQPADGGVITLKNQPDVQWRKQGGPRP